MSLTEKCIKKEISCLEKQIKVLNRRLKEPHDINDKIIERLEFYTIQDNFIVQNRKVMECQKQEDIKVLIAPAGTYAKELLSSINKADCDKDLYNTLKFYAHNYLEVSLFNKGNKIEEAWDDGYECWSREPGFHAKLAIENYKKSFGVINN